MDAYEIISLKIQFSVALFTLKYQLSLENYCCQWWSTNHH